VLLDVFDDVFLLHFPLESAKSTLNRLTFLNFHFGHSKHPLSAWDRQRAVPPA
jgi:hypothetical protein